MINWIFFIHPSYTSFYQNGCIQVKIFTYSSTLHLIKKLSQNKFICWTDWKSVLDCWSCIEPMPNPQVVACVRWWNFWTHLSLEICSLVCLSLREEASQAASIIFQQFYLFQLLFASLFSFFDIDLTLISFPCCSIFFLPLWSWTLEPAAKGKWLLPRSDLSWILRIGSSLHNNCSLCMENNIYNMSFSLVYIFPSNLQLDRSISTIFLFCSCNPQSFFFFSILTWCSSIGSNSAYINPATSRFQLHPLFPSYILQYLATSQLELYFQWWVGDSINK